MKKLLEKLPYWFKAKGSNDSSTKSLLDSIGNELLNLENEIKRFYKNTNLKTFNVPDYKVIKFICGSFKTIVVNGELINVINDEREFIKNIENNIICGMHDHSHGIFYISTISAYDSVTCDNKKVELLEHRIWNCDLLDEFGLLYDMPRLDSESNENYRNRLYSYSNNRASNSIHGISSYIGHSLSLYKNIEWIDGSTTIEISSDNIMSSSIFVDGQPFEAIVNGNKASLAGDKKYRGISRTVTYFYGFDIKSITCVDVDIELAEKISIECPIMYGYARWNDAMFVLPEEEDEYIRLCSNFDDDLSWIKF